jgi:hypothetical protein
MVAGLWAPVGAWAGAGARRCVCVHARVCYDIDNGASKAEQKSKTKAKKQNYVMTTLQL